MCRKQTFVVALVLLMTSPVLARSIEQVHGFEPRFLPPPDAGMVSITDYGAVPDDGEDDTEAFKQAFGEDQPRAIYLPAGTYLLSEPIRYGVDAPKKKKVAVFGESRSSTIIKLAPHSEGFDDPDNPRVFWHTRHPDQQGEQNMHNYLQHLTLEIGEGNPGAIALNFHTNNTGVVKDVAIRATDPLNHPGHTGIACVDWEVGPGGLRYVSVEGFDTGIALTRAGNYITAEHVTLRHCHTGIHAETSSIRGLVAEHCQRPVVSRGHTVLLDAELAGSGDAAIDNEGGLLARNIRTAGFDLAIRSNTASGNVSNAVVDEYTSEPPVYTWEPAGEARTLNLPVKDSPELPYPESADEWVVMPTEGDIADDLQRAIDGGAEHILISGYGTRIESTVHVRNNVKRIMGAGNAYVRFMTEDEPVFRIEDGTPDTVLFELLYANYGSSSELTYEHASPRTLVIRHGGSNYRTADEGAGGEVFIESNVGDPLVFGHVHAWVRGANTEQGGPQPTIVNEGGTLWLLGQKTEDFATKLRTVNGTTELLGGVYRQNHDASDFERTGLDRSNPPPLFEAIDSNVSLTYVSWGPNVPYEVLVRATRDGETRELRRDAHDGSAALFVGYSERPEASGQSD
ncbi:MAG: glycosyl hydrolase family 28-related protein [Phycisphaeraceae bacterium]